MSQHRPDRSRSGLGKGRNLGDLERVQVRHDVPEHGLKRGERGTIVHVFNGIDAYLVEFVNPEDSSTRAEIEVTPKDIMLAGS